MADVNKQRFFGSLKMKVGAFSVCILLAVAAVCTGSALRTIVMLQKYTLQKQRDVMLDSYDEKIQWQVQNVLSLIKTYDSIYSGEGLSLDERKARIKEIVRGLRYGTEGYFWIDTYAGENVLLPPKPETEGTNRLDWKRARTAGSPISSSRSSEATSPSRNAPTRLRTAPIHGSSGRETT